MSSLIREPQAIYQDPPIDKQIIMLVPQDDDTFNRVPRPYTLKEFLARDYAKWLKSSFTREAAAGNGVLRQVDCLITLPNLLTTDRIPTINAINLGLDSLPEYLERNSRYFTMNSRGSLHIVNINRIQQALKIFGVPKEARVSNPQPPKPQHGYFL